MTTDIYNKISPYVSVNPEIMGGVVRFKRTRIPLSLILKQVSLGWSLSQIKENFPDINLTHLSKIITILSHEVSYIEYEEKNEERAHYRGEDRAFAV